MTKTTIRVTGTIRVDGKEFDWCKTEDQLLEAIADEMLCWIAAEDDDLMLTVEPQE